MMNQSDNFSFDDWFHNNVIITNVLRKRRLHSWLLSNDINTMEALLRLPMSSLNGNNNGSKNLTIGMKISLFAAIEKLRGEYNMLHS